jgi:hypothetical protein
MKNFIFIDGIANIMLAQGLLKKNPAPDSTPIAAPAAQQ